MRLILMSAASALALTACSQPADTGTNETAENTAADASDTAQSEREIDVALDYPETRRVDHTDTYQSAERGEVEVADPYRWLEDDVRENSEVADWVEAQNALTFAYLEEIPGREAIADRMEELYDYERFSLPDKEGGKYFFSRNDGLQDQSVFYVQDNLEGEPRVLIDPNTWSEDGTVALAGAWPSPDGRYLAYSIQDGGSDWRTIEVLDIESGEPVGDRIEWVKFSGVSWAKDGSGFYYSRYPEPEEGEQFTSLNVNQAAYFHEIGTPQSQDREVVSDAENPEIGWGVGETDDGEYLVINSWRGTDGSGISVLDLDTPDAEPVEIFEGFANNHYYIGNEGSRFLFFTDLDAPNGRVVSVDLENPDELTDVIAESEAPIEGVSLVGGHLILERLEDVKSAVGVYTTQGELVREVELPGIGATGGFGGEADDPETFYSFTSFNRPTTIYRYNVETGESEVFREPDLTFNPDDFVVEQVFYESTGGAQIPMFIVHHRDVEPNGEQPTLLYGYGGFAISLTPTFSTSNLQWMEMGGVYAVANLRGGAEYGRDWHDAGRLFNKQNVFDDFANAGEELIDLGWTSPANLAISGRSNGGLLVGAVTNQRPNLFAAALPGVGVMDMLRFNQFTAGRFWVDDYGSPQDPEMFDYLSTYSPYQNIEDGAEYPAIMVTTADTDDRVVPGHSFKYTAALQEADTGDEPALIRIETRAGHGAGTPVSKLIEQKADEWAFIGFHTGVDLDGYAEGRSGGAGTRDDAETGSGGSR
ncbi:prolyl oligopeptidase family serine peptidase [Marinicauda pacifica]|uniref:prolyl oligopeptidase n=1 Tax=Marinicauda pacifica TaxID=1133559 RepID=A0A4S2HDL9_9PROT|nr:prolyl oligopeptidase family serine peptidase [Marinicauda pacifica]TGY94140.1 S9 family peptidase [Marinicauda pacifica]